MASTGIGERLRSAREALGLSLEEVEAATRIRRSYLQALEQEAFDRLPGPAYARGFLRAYATHLGLRPEDIPELSRPGAASAGPPPGKTAPVEVRLTPGAYLSPARRALVGLAILVGIGVVFVAYVLYGQVRQFVQTSPAPHPAAAPQGGSATARPAPSSGMSRPAPSYPRGGSSTPAKPAAPAAPTVKPAVPGAPAPAAGTPGAQKPGAATQAPQAQVPAAGAPAKPPAAAPPSPAGAVPGTAAKPAAVGPAAAPPAGSEKPSGQAQPAPAASGAPLKVAVAATGHAWVRTVADGTTVFEGFLNSGDKQVWQANKTLTVRVGNAAAIAISVNGKPVGPLGGEGQIYEHSFSAGTP
jgi:cytoskeleton protein RodZ